MAHGTWHSAEGTGIGTGHRAEGRGHMADGGRKTGRRPENASCRPETRRIVRERDALFGNGTHCSENEIRRPETRRVVREQGELFGNEARRSGTRRAARKTRWVAAEPTADCRLQNSRRRL